VPCRKEKTFPPILYERKIIPATQEMKILGNFFDWLRTGTPHINNARAKGFGRTPIIKAVMGPSWGFTMEDGLLTYKALFLPVLGNVAPVWYPLCLTLKHPVDPIQKVQNAVLCTITGCHAASSIQHLHDKCKMLQVHQHLDMQCSQFLLNTQQVSHPSHDVTSRPPGPRTDRKPTLQHRFNCDIDQFTSNGVEIALIYKKHVKAIHISEVASALASREPNYVLGYPAPEVHPSDATIPRATCTTMRQLHSGHCNTLQLYKHKINIAVDVSCPCCCAAPHSVVHLFSCHAAPTTLQPIDMWARPREVAEFVLSLPPSLTFPL
jgi:hypothetical protein